MQRHISIAKFILSALFACALIPAAAFAGPFDTCDYTIKVPDGRYEFVWKPTGAHRPQAVLVLPGRFKGWVGGDSHKALVVRSVTLYRADNFQKIGTMPMKSTGICPGGGECLNRPSFAHPTLSGAAIKRRFGNIRIRVVSNVSNHVHCTPEFNPAKRQD